MSSLLEVPIINNVEYPLPTTLDRVPELVDNLWWSWDEAGRSLWSALDADLWDKTHNPVDILTSTEPHRWRELADRETVQERYRDAVERLDNYLSDRETWFDRQRVDLGGPVAYLCTEFGVHASVPFYSGGLGILAGDHLKSASDMGIPLVAVGLFYRRGYFRQEVDADGDQQHIYPVLDPHRLPVRPVAAPSGGQLKCSVELPGRNLTVAAWRLAVGRVPLVLLDTDIPENDPTDRPITHTLYVRGREMRFLQELVLGVGAVRALEALGIQPAVWHANEGHAALSVLERAAGEVERGADLEQARQRVRARSVFTLHTPVPAGNEIFPRAIPDKYMAPWAQRLGVDLDGLAEMARAHDPDTFDMGALAIRFSGFVNGVSRRHGEVVTRDWSWLIGHEAAAITNGVHTPTWVGRGGLRMLRAQLGLGWAETLLDNPAGLEKLHSLPLDELWSLHRARKEMLIRFIQGRIQRQIARHGGAPDDLRKAERLLSPDVLTIGFARRFATYKRATLMFRDLDRLTSIVTNSQRPINLLFAGKAHPADDHGQALIRHLVELSRTPGLAGHLFMLEDYDTRMARFLVQGCDVWVNNPRPPMEASGTSGMKAAMNGVLNLSVLDGWWAEGYEGDNGWSFGLTEPHPDHEAADRHDADDFYRVLADQVAPLYYARDETGLPAEWVEMMRRSIISTLVRFSSHRMVAEYLTEAYAPAAT